MKHRNILLALFLLPLTALATEVKSPNGNIVVTFDVVDGRPTYSMTYKGRDVIKPSHLGLELAKDKHASKGLQESDLMDGFVILSSQGREVDDTWEPVWGETSEIRNHYNEMAFYLEQTKRSTSYTGDGTAPGLALIDQSRHMIIRFRVYDDGIGFRYEFPQQENLNYFLIK